MQQFERITHALRCEYTQRVARLHEAIARCKDKECARAKDYRATIAFYMDVLAVVRRHEPGTMKIAKLSDVSGRAA